MPTRPWWQTPRLRTDEDDRKHREVTWLELFFDLVFVVAIAEVAHSLAEHPSLDGVLHFVLLFVPIWFTWMAATYYTERFETEGIENRLIFYVQMLVVAGLAIFAHDGLGATYVGYALSYAAGRLFLTVLWVRAGWHDERFRPVSNRYAIGFSISILLIVVSVFVASPLRFILFGLALLIDVGTPVLTLAHQRRLPRFSSSKLPERFGLFTIIVLGETIVGVVQGVAGGPALTWGTALAGALALAVGFGLWWIYFDFIARRPPKPDKTAAFFWGYLHMPLTMAIAAAGAGILNLLVAGVGAAPPATVRLLVAGAAAAALVTMGLLELTLQRAEDEPTHPRLSPALKFGAGIAVLLVGWIGGGWTASALLGAVFLLLLVPMTYGAIVWFTQEVPASSVTASHPEGV